MVSTNDKLTNGLIKGDINLQQWLASIQQDPHYKNSKSIQGAVELIKQVPDHAHEDSDDSAQIAFVTLNLLRDLKLDGDTLAASLVTELVEKQKLTLAEIDQSLGSEIATLVDGVRRMSFINRLNQEVLSSKPDDQSEALRRMLLAMASDIRVVLITLAERVGIMRSAKNKPVPEQQVLAGETMDIYAPLANRLGIWQIKWELEDLSFRYLEPQVYKKIAKLLDERRLDRERYITQFVNRLEKRLKQTGLEALIKGRPKHIYSIWRKMQRKNLSFDQIFDVRAVRVIVPTVTDCYTALGLVHSDWNYIRGEFDDYIAAPKDNMYQSLHTAVIGPDGKTVEIQIRTPEMDEHAELGVAAHWLYKEGSAHDQAFQRKLAGLRQILEWKDDITSASEFIEELKDETFQDQVYVLTPKGDIIDLPKGSTALDFAYRIHTDVGHRCRGAKVNGKMVPLATELQNSQVVDILTVKQGGPSRDWLNPNLGYLRSAKARAKVQQWFKQQNFDANAADGRTIVERELHRLGITEVNYEKLAQQFNFNKADKFFAAVGRGDIKTAQIINLLQETNREEEPEIHLSHVPQARRQAESDVYILGVGDLLTNMARCCKPVPGDPIIGYITRGRGVTVHRRDCQNILRYNTEAPQRLVEVQWGVTAESTYPVDVHIVAFDRQGLLRDITSVLANESINVIASNTFSDKKEHKAHMTLTLEIKNLSQLSRVLVQINQLPNVVEVNRRH
jgi:GTP pyrophosphokinase